VKLGVRQIGRVEPYTLTFYVSRGDEEKRKVYKSSFIISVFCTTLETSFYIQRVKSQVGSHPATLIQHSHPNI